MDGRNEALLDLGRSVRGDNFPSPPPAPGDHSPPWEYTP